MIIGVMLVTLNQFCGVFAMLNYTATIFKESGSTMTPNASAIVVAVIQILGSSLSTFLVDRAGRKVSETGTMRFLFLHFVASHFQFLLVLSAIGTSLGLLSLSSYIYAKTIGLDTESFNWVPIASFSFVILLASMGVLTLPFMVIAEVMPDKVCTARARVH